MASYTQTQYIGDRSGDSLFWGQLINQAGHPSQILCRFSDALFFHCDANAEVSNRNTGLIEPMKWSWASVQAGNDPKFSNWIATNEMASLYNLASLTYKSVQLQDGLSVPALDRAALLRLIVWEFEVDPVSALLGCNRQLAAFRLVDPMTRQPFPSPIPQSAITGLSMNKELRFALTQWQTMVQINSTRAQSNAYISPPSPISPSYIRPTRVPASASPSQPSTSSILAEQQTLFNAGYGNSSSILADQQAQSNLYVSPSPSFTTYTPNAAPFGLDASSNAAIQVAHAQIQAAQAMASAAKKQNRASMFRSASGLATSLLSGNLSFGN